jgi:phage tail-like protein
MTDSPARRSSSYLDYLPAIFRQDASGANVLGRFLLAFEQVLTGLGDPALPGLEELLDGIVDADGSPILAGSQRYFDPGPAQPASQRAPSEFLDWLAGWVALSVRADWTDDEKRRFISQIVALYRQRGTRDGLIAMLKAYTGLTSDDAVRVYEFDNLPHYFQVELSLGLRQGDIAFLERKEQIARAIIDQEKPAHTFYALRIRGVPTMQLGVVGRSTVGVSTLLGSPED